MTDFVLIDFDTVISEAAQRIGDKIEGPPNPHALETLHALCVDRRFPVAVISRHSSSSLGPDCLREWFTRYGFDPAVLVWLQFPINIPPFSLFVSRRSFNPSGAPLPPPDHLAGIVNRASLPLFAIPREDDHPGFPTTDTFGGDV